MDDYHFIQTAAIHENIAFLLTHLPVALHLVIITRTDPPLPLPQLRVRRQMMEIRDMDLRLDVQETAVAYNQSALKLGCKQGALTSIVTVLGVLTQLYAQQGNLILAE